VHTLPMRSLVLLVFCGTLLAQTNPIPFVDQPLVPASAAPGGAGFTLILNGTGFVSGSMVKWNGSVRSTTFISRSQLHATISAADIASAMSAAVTVSNPSPGGGTSNPASFQVTLPAPGVAVLRRDIGLNSGFNPIAAAAGDFNGDGNLDEVSGGQSNRIDARQEVSLGAGNGGIRRPQRRWRRVPHHAIAPTPVAFPGLLP